MTTVLHGCFDHTLTKRVIPESVQEVRQCRHDQFDHQCGYYNRIMHHVIQLCHTVDV